VQLPQRVNHIVWIANNDRYRRKRSSTAGEPNTELGEKMARFAREVLFLPILFVRFSCKKRRIGAENAHLWQEKR